MIFKNYYKAPVSSQILQLFMKKCQIIIFMTGVDQDNNRGFNFFWSEHSASLLMLHIAG